MRKDRPASLKGEPICNLEEKEPTMSRNIAEAILYAALAIVHFIWRS
jgi:hypothetical protein